MTGRVLAQQWVSADGFVAGPDGDEGTLFATVDAADFAASEVHNRALLGDATEVLLGRRTYEIFRGFWPEADDQPIADLVNGLPKTVFSTGLDEAPWGRFAPCRIARDAVAHASAHRTSGTGLAVVWGSISIMHALLGAGQLDELELLVAPAFLGTGTPLAGAARPLRRVDVQEWPGGTVRVRYAA